jgi:Flp pilus assembly protein TadG
MTRSGNRRRGRSGSTALEFAIIASVFLPMCIGIVEGGLLLWTYGALQTTAALTARRAAIASPDCPAVPAYAVTTAGKWVFPGIIANANVVSTTTCISHVNYQQVTITCNYWAGGLLPAPLNGTVLKAVAYFAVSTC